MKKKVNNTKNSAYYQEILDKAKKLSTRPLNELYETLGKAVIKDSKVAKKKVKKVKRKPSSATFDMAVLKVYINVTLGIVPNIHSDVINMFRECGEKMTDSKLLTALTECAMEQAEFRGAKFPEEIVYADVYRIIKKEIKAQYFT